MQPIIYDVAVSIDGYISGPGGDISQFAESGAVVDDYAARLATYATAIMGRATYAFGYRFGMRPGDNPYQAMQTFVFSDRLELPDTADVEVRPAADAAAIRAVRDRSPGPLYLCGGGAFAGSLLAMGLIDRLRLKRAPIILGGGTRLFAANATPARLDHIETREYDDGYLYQDFRVVR